MPLLLKRFKTDILNHYTTNEPHDDLRKMRHIMYLEHYYDHSRFQNCECLQAERVKFLTELQEMVDSTLF